MIEEQSFESISHENSSLNIDGNSAISRNGYDLDRYDFYLEKIRGLLLPSLEPRIQSCLETFIYRKDAGSLFESPYLKRCLDVAAAWRNLVDAFSIKWGDEKFLENMLGQAVKYLIKDGLVDCFLNSIILNNRINKICRDLDALGADRDLLRYLTVWNYMNERDYWIENEQIARSTPRHDSIDRQSDLDVEIGSKVCDCKDNESKRALKRRATEDSSEDPPKKNDESADNLDTMDRSAPENWTCIDSSIREESKSNVKRRARFIRKTLSCTPSTCSTYVIKKTQLDGKILKLKIFKSCSGTSIRECSRVMEKSKLYLPCKSNELMSKIIKSYSSLLGSSSIVGRKRLQATINNICRRINEILGKMDVNEIRNCRLDCEVFREHVSFRLVGREANGCKVCLLVDRVVINKTDVKSRSASRGSSVGRLDRIPENDNSQESGVTIYESAQFDLPDDGPKIIPDFEAIVETENDANVLDFSEVRLEPTKLDIPKESSHNDFNNGTGVEDQACRCDVLGFSGFDHEDSNQKIDPMPESAGKISPTHSEKNSPEDQECHCNCPAEEITNHIDHNTKKVQENPHSSPLDTGSNNENSLIRKKTLINLFDSVLKGEEALGDPSFEVTRDHDVEKQENSRNEPIEECLCDSSLIKPLDRFEHDIENSENCMGCLDKIIKDDPEPQGTNSINEMCVSNSRETREHQNEEMHDSLVENISPIDHEVLKPDGNERSIECDNIVCECPSVCLCINKKIPNEETADCDSQCSCDSCTDINPKTSLKDPIDASNTNRVIAEPGTKVKEDLPLAQRSPVISARLPKSKPQRINISIELCSESESSLKMTDKNEKKNTSMVHVGSKNFEHLKHVVTKVPSSLRRSGSISVDRGNCNEHVNSQWEANAKGQSSGDSRMHSPPRPLESRDYLPRLERPSRMRNRNAYAFSLKSGGHSYDKFERRTLTQRIVKNYDAKQLCESIKNRRCFDQINREKIQSDSKKKSEELSRDPGKSQKFSHLCHGFSTSSLDRMRHLIKTKLRRILLERDKSTNTPKTTRANRKYRCNVSERKIESSSFAQTRCRTIWESHSATDSTRTSRSFVSTDRNFRAKVRDSDKITKVLYSSAIGPEISCSNYSTNSLDSRQLIKNRRIKNYPRLAGGGEFVASKKRLGSKKPSCMRQKHYDFIKKPVKKEIRRSSYSQIGKPRENLANRNVHNSETLQKNEENDPTPRSVKLDSTANSTSRYICLYEFAQFEDRSNESKNFKNSHDRKNSRLSQRPIDALRCVDALKKTSSNNNTINYRRKGFTNLDDDLRTKLSQYVSLCKNAKYSLLKRLRPGDVYEVSATSIAHCDRYKFEVS